MGVLAIEDGHAAPARAGFVETVDFGGDPESFLDGSAEFDDTDFFAVAIFGAEGFGREERRFFVVGDHLARNAKNFLSGAVVLGK